MRKGCLGLFHPKGGPWGRYPAIGTHFFGRSAVFFFSPVLLTWSAINKCSVGGRVFLFIYINTLVAEIYVVARVATETDTPLLASV